MLDVIDVRAGYGRLPVLFDVSFGISAGELVAILGPNGAGKSTTLKTILGLVRPTRGTVVFDGVQVTAEPPSARFTRGIALSPEGRRIFGNLTVSENLTTGTSGVADLVAEEQRQKVFELFPVLGERQAQRAGSLSGGEQQMLAIGRALMSRPKLLMIDELSMGLAPLVVADLYEALRRLADEGLAVIVVDQFASKLVATADRAVVIEKGRIVFDGSQDEADTELLAGATLGLGRH